MLVRFLQNKADGQATQLKGNHKMSEMFALLETTLKQAVKEVDAERLSREVNEKFCPACVKMHPIEAFSWRSAKHLVRKTTCKACIRLQQEKYKVRKDNGNKIRTYQQRKAIA